MNSGYPTTEQFRKNPAFAIGFIKPLSDPIEDY